MLLLIRYLSPHPPPQPPTPTPMPSLSWWTCLVLFWACLSLRTLSHMHRFHPEGLCPWLHVVPQVRGFPTLWVPWGASLLGGHHILLFIVCYHKGPGLICPWDQVHPWCWDPCSPVITLRGGLLHSPWGFKVTSFSFFFSTTSSAPPVVWPQPSVNVLQRPLNMVLYSRSTIVSWVALNLTLSTDVLNTVTSALKPPGPSQLQVRAFSCTQRVLMSAVVGTVLQCTRDAFASKL